jgi:outer membrane protein assembly factor BamB
MTKVIKICAAGSVFLFAAACALRPAQAPSSATQLVFPLAEESRIPFDGEIIGHPLALGKNVVISVESGRIIGVDTAGKKILWQFDAAAPLAAPALAGPDFVIVFDRAGRMTRLAGDGKEEWRKEVTGSITSAPVSTGGEVLAVFDLRALRAFDTATGAEKWTYTVPGDVRSGPRVWKDRLVLLTADKRVIVLATGGKAVSGFSTPSAASGPLLVSGDRLFAGFENGGIEAWDLAARKRKWSVKTGAALAADPVDDPVRLYFLTQSRVVFALDKKRGDVLWWRNLPGRPVGPAVLWSAHLFAPSLAPSLTSFEIPAGTPDGPVDLKQDIVSAPLVLGDRLAVAVRDPATLKEALALLKSTPPALPEPPKKKSGAGE